MEGLLPADGMIAAAEKGRSARSRWTAAYEVSSVLRRGEGVTPPAGVPGLWSLPPKRGPVTRDVRFAGPDPSRASSGVTGVPVEIVRTRLPERQRLSLRSFLHRGCA